MKLSVPILVVSSLNPIQFVSVVQLRLLFSLMPMLVVLVSRGISATHRVRMGVSEMGEWKWRDASFTLN